MAEIQAEVAAQPRSRDDILCSARQAKADKHGRDDPPSTGVTRLLSSCLKGDVDTPAQTCPQLAEAEQRAFENMVGSESMVSRAAICDLFGVTELFVNKATASKAQT